MKKKGFTLIELLAVIVILAIIALITVPVVINIINSSKKGAAEDSTYGVIEAMKINWVGAQSGFIHEWNNLIYDCANDTCVMYDGKSVKVLSTPTELLYNTVSGTKPTEGKFIIKSGETSVLGLRFGEYVCKTIDGKASCEKKAATSYKPSKITELGATHKGIVYLNPIDLRVECNESNSQIGTGEANPSGCMKFYIYDDSGDTYKMILDHNIISSVPWNSTGTNTEIKEAAIQLAEDTAEWEGNPRIPTANEIALAANITTFVDNSMLYFGFDGQITMTEAPSTRAKGTSRYTWLFNYLGDCEEYGCDIESPEEQLGYWTSTRTVGTSNLVWEVAEYGVIIRGTTFGAFAPGVRPVIEISKLQING